MNYYAFCFVAQHEYKVYYKNGITGPLMQFSYANVLKALKNEHFLKNPAIITAPETISEAEFKEMKEIGALEIK